MKKLICWLLAVLMLLSCSLTALAIEEKTVVTVNGEAIAQSELGAMIDTISARVSQYGIDGTDESVLEVIRASALEELVDDHLLTQDMTAQGCYDMSEDEESAISAVAQASLENLLKQYEAYFTEYLDGTEDVGMTAADLAQTYLSGSGYTLKYLENYYRNALASEKYEQWLMEGEPEVTDEDIQQGYAQRVEESKSAYENDVPAFETALSSGQEVWYRPGGYRAILQIMLSAQGEDDAAKLASVREKTDDIYARLEQGERFETLIAEYGQDGAFDSESFYETGYQVHPDSILWEDDFKQAAFGENMQKPGDYSQPVVFGDNVHIFYYLRDISEGAAELTDSLAAALREELNAERSASKIQARLEQLKEAAEIIYASEAE